MHRRALCVDEVKQIKIELRKDRWCVAVRKATSKNFVSSCSSRRRRNNSTDRRVRVISASSSTVTLTSNSTCQTLCQTCYFQMRQLIVGRRSLPPGVQRTLFVSQIFAKNSVFYALAHFTRSSHTSHQIILSITLLLVLVTFVESR